MRSEITYSAPSDHMHLRALVCGAKPFRTSRAVELTRKSVYYVLLLKELFLSTLGQPHRSTSIEDKPFNLSATLGDLPFTIHRMWAYV